MIQDVVHFSKIVLLGCQHVFDLEWLQTVMHSLKKLFRAL